MNTTEIQNFKASQRLTTLRFEIGQGLNTLSKGRFYMKHVRPVKRGIKKTTIDYMTLPKQTTSQNTMTKTVFLTNKCTKNQKSRISET